MQHDSLGLFHRFIAGIANGVYSLLRADEISRTHPALPLPLLPPQTAKLFVGFGFRLLADHIFGCIYFSHPVFQLYLLPFPGNYMHTRHDKAQWLCRRRAPYSPRL